MKKFLKVAIVIFIHLIVLSACSNKNELTGVYMAENVSMPSNAIILYNDGLCSYLGDATATWESNADSVTITKRDPDNCYIDIYCDSALIGDVAGKCTMHENTYSLQVSSSEGKIRITPNNSNNLEQAQEELSAINGVTKAELVIIQGDVHEYKFKIVDNSLVSSDGKAYMKQEN